MKKKYKERNSKDLFREEISYTRPEEEASEKVGQGEEDRSISEHGLSLGSEKGGRD